LAAIFGLSFYIRRRIGMRLWRRVHPLVIVAYVLAVAHTLGAGTDGSTVWLRTWLVLTASIILVLLAIRVRSSLGRLRPAPDSASPGASGPVRRRSPEPVFGPRDEPRSARSGHRLGPIFACPLPAAGRSSSTVATGQALELN
jgi:hypothetical protein